MVRRADRSFKALEEEVGRRDARAYEADRYFSYTIPSVNTPEPFLQTFLTYVKQSRATKS